MDFARVVEQIKLNLGIGDEEICRGLGIGAVTLENYLSGYVDPSPEVLQNLFWKFSVIKAEVSAPLGSFEFPGKRVEAEAALEKICFGRRFAVPVGDNSLDELMVFAGSYAIIEQAAEPEDGDVILASVGGEDTRLYAFSGGESVTLLGDGEIVMSREDFEKNVRVAGRLVCTMEKIDGEMM